MLYKNIYLHQLKDQDISNLVHPRLTKKYLNKLKIKKSNDEKNLIIIHFLPKKDGVLDPSNKIKLDIPFSIRSYLKLLINNKKTITHHPFIYNKNLIYPSLLNNQKNYLSYTKESKNENFHITKKKTITDIINKIIDDNIVQDFINQPSGKCFDSAKRIGDILKSYGIKEENIKYRLCQITRPGMTWLDVNRDNNKNHMAVLLIHENSTYIFDPTIIQFIGIKDPFFGTESSWIEAMKPVWNGYVIKKAVQYIDYNTFNGADNASIMYQINFDEMAEKGGIFINYPEWYKKHNKKYNKKNKSLFSCLKRKVKE